MYYVEGRTEFCFFPVSSLSEYSDLKLIQLRMNGKRSIDLRSWYCRNFKVPDFIMKYKKT